MSLKNNLRFYAGQVSSRLDDPMKILSEKSKFNIRTESVSIGEDFKSAGVKTKLAKQLTSEDFKKVAEYWKAKGYAAGTIQNKATILRAICNAAGNENIKNINNGELGIASRNVLNPNNVNGATVISEKSLEKINLKNPEVTAALRLEAAYGLRREESAHVVFELTKGHTVTAPGKENILIMKGSWCKNGRQRGKTTFNGRPNGELILRDGGTVLKQVAASVKGININYRVEQFERKINYATDKCKKWDGNPDIHPHALRHNYAHERYREITGRDCPAAGGLKYSDMSSKEQKQYHSAAKIISEELGHSRETISRTYIGK